MLAIIIPYFKISFFEQTLESLANQSNKQFRVYIGNDASNEDPTHILELYNSRFHFDYVRFDTNLGGTSLVNQWKRCISLANNEKWIMILGDDDLLSVNFVNDFYQNLESINSNNINVIRFSSVVIDELGNSISDFFFHPTIEKSTDFLSRKFSKQTRSSLSEYIFKKEMIFNKFFRDFPLAWHSDDMAVLELSNFDNVFSINTSYTSVRVSEISLTGNDNFAEQKNHATFLFCKIIFKQYSSYFSLEQKSVILTKLEIAYFNIPTWFNYIVISSYYCNIIGFKPFICFQKRVIKVVVVKLLKQFHLFNLVKYISKKK